MQRPGPTPHRLTKRTATATRTTTATTATSSTSATLPTPPTTKRSQRSSAATMQQQPSKTVQRPACCSPVRSRIRRRTGGPLTRHARQDLRHRDVKAIQTRSQRTPRQEHQPQNHTSRHPRQRLTRHTRIPRDTHNTSAKDAPPRRQMDRLEPTRQPHRIATTPPNMIRAHMQLCGWTTQNISPSHKPFRHKHPCH